MDTFGLKIIASDGVFYEGRCKKLIIPAPDGEKGILANHENMVIAVNVGVAHMSLDGEDWKDSAVGVQVVGDDIHKGAFACAVWSEQAINARR